MSELRPRGAAILAVVLSVARAAAGALPVEGVTDTEVLIGQCAPLSGSLGTSGMEMNYGLRAAFLEANSRGGVHGRLIRLLSDDDGYEPERCVECTAKMIGENNVFALAGYVGTPTAKVAVPIAQELKVPLVGLLSGALLLRQPALRYVVNIRASYDDETEALIGYLVGTAAASRIAVFYQNDSFGLSGLRGVEKALARRNITLTARGSFERNTIAVKSGLARVMAGTPDTVIVVAPYKPTAEFMRAAREAGLRSRFAAVSFNGIEKLIAGLGSGADGMIVSQVLPSPSDTTVAVTRDYQTALRSVAPDVSPSYVSFEGYVIGRVLLAAMDRAGRDLDREKLIDAFDGMEQLDVGGMTFSFSALKHQGSDLVFLSVIRDGRGQAVPYERSRR